MTLQSNPSRRFSKGRPQQQTRPESMQAVSSAQRSLRSLFKALSLAAVAGASSPISQIALSPVYGSIPSALYHDYLTALAFLLAWAWKSRIPKAMTLPWINYLPVVAAAVPTLQFYLFQFSRQFGPVYGPLITEFLTYCPLVGMTIVSVAEIFDTVHLTQDGQHMSTAWSMLASYVAFGVFERVLCALIARYIGFFIIFTRIGLQFLVMAFYALLLPSKALAWCTIFLFHILCLNDHSSLPWPTEMREKTLRNHQFSIVDRQESLTGYLSVLDSLKDGFRVMRCDHSLLGGEWDPHTKVSSLVLKEPVYSIFVILEAVRLVINKSAEPRLRLRDKEKHALVM